MVVVIYQRIRAASCISLLALSVPACVAQGRYDALVADGQKKESEHNDALSTAHAETEQVRNLVSERETRLGAAADTQHKLQEALDEANAQNEAMRKDLVLYGRDSAALLGDRNRPELNTDEVAAMTVMLRRANARVERLTNTVRNSGGPAADLLASGELRIEVRRARAAVLIAGENVFAMKRAVISPSGGKLLADIVRALVATAQPEAGQRVMVVAHTDTVPESPKLRTRLDLSVQRSLAAYTELSNAGLKPEQLVLSGAGPFDPIALPGLVGPNAVELSF